MLFNSVILEVAIGIFFIYLVTSLLCSGISELITGIFNLRARRLKQGINNLLKDEENKELINSFYDSKLIQGLFTPSFMDIILYRRENSEPSYIPANIFARVLRDVLTNEGEELTKDWNEVWTYLKNHQAAGTLTAPQKELLGVLNTAGLDQNKVNRLSILKKQLDDARTALRIFSEQPVTPDITPTGKFLMDQVSHLENSVRQVEREINGAMERAQLYVEDYFNQAMDRVSGWYKRNVQVILFGIAAVITLLLNIDSLYIIDMLMQAPTTRAALIQMAEEHVAEANPAPTGEATIPTADAAAPLQPVPLEPTPQAGTTPQAGAVPQAPTPAAETKPSTGTATLGTFDAIEAAGLNLGWDHCVVPLVVEQRLDPMLKEGECSDNQLRSTDSFNMWWAKKFMGLLLTVIAASLGAPFWFDLLNKAVNLRLTGQKPPEKSVTTQIPPTA